MARMKNKNKKIHNQHRKKTAGQRKIDIEDPFYLGEKRTSFRCQFCGSKMHPYKLDEYGDIVMACDNEFCVNAEGFDGSVNAKLSKLTREMQLHSRYYVDYFGSTYAGKYNPYRKARYWDKGTEYI